MKSSITSCHFPKICCYSQPIGRGLAPFGSGAGPPGNCAEKGACPRMPSGIIPHTGNKHKETSTKKQTQRGQPDQKGTCPFRFGTGTNQFGTGTFRQMVFYENRLTEMYLSRTDLYLSQTGMDMSPNYRRAVRYSRRLLPRDPNTHCFRLPNKYAS